MKKRLLSLLVTLSMLLLLLPTTALAAETFPDVGEEQWFHGAVLYVSEQGLMAAGEDGLFRPRDAVTRGEVLAILAKLEGAGDARAWAVENAISDGSALESPVTRQQLITILYRYAKFKGMDVSVGEDTNILSYADAFDVSEYAFAAFQWACGAGILQGKSGSLLPHDHADRAHTAVILARFFQGA